MKDNNALLSERCNITVITSNSKTRNGSATTVMTVAKSTGEIFFSLMLFTREKNLVTKEDVKWRGAVGGDAQLLYTSKLKIIFCNFLTPRFYRTL